MNKRRILKMIFILSLALNIAAIAFVTTQWVRHSHVRENSGMLFNRHAALSALENDRRSEVAGIWRSKRDEIREELKSYRKNNRKLARLLFRGELDDSEIRIAHTQMTTHRANAEKLLFELVLQSAQIMTEEERQKFFKRGFQNWRHNRPHRKQEGGAGINE
ncbi:periplasmic heavy metal sensor [Sneathiella glossodoripedis]|uniref:periplasmic heavy metal sensor n=1 Tax=Sneathiella glossodoripedis TaxID=418853 RepID=UPI000472D087|nr:periplasmic heavy metal sensor [Sneathiella glossodoripedis]